MVAISVGSIETTITILKSDWTCRFFNNYLAWTGITTVCASRTAYSLDGVVIHLPIFRKERGVFSLRLRHQEMVKRITMMQRQRHQDLQVFGLYRQQREAFLRNGCQNIVHIRIQFSDADFNRNLP